MSGDGIATDYPFALMALLLTCVLVTTAGCAYLSSDQVRNERELEVGSGLMMPGPPSGNPVDFTKLRSCNPDIYAWLYVPGTKIDYPVLQHPTDDSHYLHANDRDEPSSIGAIYTELANSKEFDDPVTVIYGHNIRGGLMFSSLHEFENPSFSEEHPFFYIYTPERILTYGIISAAGYDDAHILNTRDLSNSAVLAGYFASVLDQSGPQKNVRSNCSLNVDNRVVQLSTCNYTHGNERYVVTGVLLGVTRSW